jgi:hypothetical protein
MASPSGHSSPSRSWSGRGYVPFSLLIVGSGPAGRRRRTEQAPAKSAFERAPRRLSGQQARSSANCSQGCNRPMIGVPTNESHSSTRTGTTSPLAHPRRRPNGLFRRWPPPVPNRAASSRSASFVRDVGSMVPGGLDGRKPFANFATECDYFATIAGAGCCTFVERKRVIGGLRVCG